MGNEEKRKKKIISETLKLQFPPFPTSRENLSLHKLKNENKNKDKPAAPQILKLKPPKFHYSLLLLPFSTDEWRMKQCH